MVNFVSQLDWVIGYSERCVYVCVCALKTLHDTMDCSLPGISVHGVLQARILECIATPFSRESFLLRDRRWVSYTAGRFFTI